MSFRAGLRFSIVAQLFSVRTMKAFGRPERQQTDAAERYAATVSGTAEYFDALLTKLEVPR
jgi:hypothetical protein